MSPFKFLYIGHRYFGEKAPFCGLNIFIISDFCDFHSIL